MIKKTIIIFFFILSVLTGLIFTGIFDFLGLRQNRFEIQLKNVSQNHRKAIHIVLSTQYEYTLFGKGVIQTNTFPDVYGKDLMLFRFHDSTVLKHHFSDFKKLSWEKSLYGIEVEEVPDHKHLIVNWCLSTLWRKASGQDSIKIQ
jgi:hypothetical protein